MVRTGFALLAAGALVLGWRSEASAQRAGGWWTPVVPQATQESGSVGTILRDAVLGAPDRNADTRGRDVRTPSNGRGRGTDRGANAQAGNGNGPPFCRNGQGHPTKGRAWCQQKGWVGNTSWAREGWGDVIFGGGRVPSEERPVRQGTIGGILGDVILGRVTRFGRDEGLSGALDGRWVPVAGGSVLQLRMGGIPLAELADLNRDGRADLVLLNYVH
jgi:hypothetical protein